MTALGEFVSGGGRVSEGCVSSVSKQLGKDAGAGVWNVGLLERNVVTGCR